MLFRSHQALGGKREGQGFATPAHVHGDRPEEQAEALPGAVGDEDDEGRQHQDHKGSAPDRAGHGPAPMPGRGGAFSVITWPALLASGNERLKRLIFHLFTAPSL